VTAPRRVLLDEAIGETRAVLLRDGRPERLLIEREAGPDPRLRLGARVRGRIRKLARGGGLAFIDLGVEPDATLSLGAAKGLSEGAAVELEITAEPRADKGPAARLIGPAAGPPGLLAPAPSLQERLAVLAPGARAETGPEVREAIDAAVEEALAATTRLSGGGLLTLEPTRALVAVDVDLAEADEAGGRAARRLNLLALAETARRLRLSALGGLIVIDLIGTALNAEEIRNAAKAAFAADQPGVTIGPVTRFGALELARPWRERPVRELLNEADGRPTPLTAALALIRALERAAAADPGGRLIARAAPEVAEAARPYASRLAERIGARFELSPDLAMRRGEIDVSAR
jgi:Ribonuclease G/E